MVWSFNVSMVPMVLQVLILLIGFNRNVFALRDLTEVRYSRGADVVDAVIARLDAAFDSTDNTFWTEGQDSLFTRDLAFVESSFGMDPNTFSNEFYRGIWQVGRSEFESTQAAVARKDEGYANKLTQISTVLGINWLDVVWEDLTKPLDSTLAARLVLHLKALDNGSAICSVIPSADEKHLYSDFWYQCYRNGLRGNASDFDRIVLPSREVCSGATDVMFILDASGSINNAHSENWNRVKSFVGNFTASLLSESSSDNRVGIITYSDYGFVNFNLTSDRDELLQEIDNLYYFGRYTNTADGLCKLTGQMWEEDNLRLVIVMTDGRSNRNSTECGTVIDAPEIVDMAICPPPLYYVIGVTDNVVEEELEAIATAPEFIDYLDAIQNTEGLAAIRRHRAYQICFRASSLTCDEKIVNKFNFGRGDRVRYQYTIRESGVTIRLCVTEGRVVLYASVNLVNPNRALNSFTLDPSEVHGIRCEDVFVTPGVISRSPQQQSVKKRQVPTSEDNDIILYVTIEGIEDSSSFTLETPKGNSTLYIVSCSQGVCGANTVCTDELVGYTCTCISGFEFEENLRDCKDVNECERHPLPCSQSAYCTNSVGSYDCTCHDGYIGNGSECTIDNKANLKLVLILTCSACGVPLLLVVVMFALIKVIWVLSSNQKNCAPTHSKY